LSDLSAGTNQPLLPGLNSQPEEKKTYSEAQTAKHLFIWAILFNRQEFAEEFWRLGNDPIGESDFFLFQRH
jgi:hypothetical protein